jgi:predicted nucleotidyltransferase
MENLTFEFHNELNPLLWENGKLKPEIQDKLLEIAQAFLDTIDIDVDVEDVTLTGSLANYNYTKYSDFDLHIITDYTDYKVDTELLKDYFNAKKTVWNTTRDIAIKGYDVEIYIQDINEPHHSTGVYSLKNDEWIKKPSATKEKAEIDLSLVSKKKQAMLDMINFALSDDCDVECAEKAKEKFMELRKAGLDKGGEFSPENLAFKELRRSGDVERLVQGILAKKDKQLSLDSVQRLQEKNFKSFMSVFNKRGPRHRQLKAGLSSLGKIGTDKVKSVGMVAQMHKINKNDTVPVHNLKKKELGSGPITNDVAQNIIAQYNLDINKIKSGQPRKLSTSNIEIGFDSQRNVFYLRKY